VPDDQATRELSRDQAAEVIVDLVGEYSLTPVEPPPPLAPITEEDIGVEGYAKLSLKKYRPITARNEDEKVFNGLR
jgi:hypothetical protein